MASACGVAPLAAAQTTPLFETETPYQLVDLNHMGSSGVALRDLTRDGRLDMFAAGTSGLWELAGNGDGTFAAAGSPLPIDSAVPPATILFADINRDGAADVIVGSSPITVLFGDTQGHLSNSETVSGPVSGLPGSSILVQDFNGDGWPDIARADPGLDVVQVWLNAGGTFPNRTDYVVQNPVGLVAADLTGDGRRDLVVASGTGKSLVVLQGVADGTFVPSSVSAALDHTPVELATADVNGDGLADFVITNDVAGDAGVTIVLQPPEFGFGAPADLVTPSHVRSLRITDVDGDQILDLIATAASDSTPGRLAVFQGDGQGSFAPAVLSGLGVGAGPIAVGDVNRDGKADVVAARTDGVRVFLQRDDGSFGGTGEFPLHPSPDDARVADLDGDGWPDLVTSSDTTAALTILPGTGSGMFGTQVTLSLSAPSHIEVIADFNHDGLPDLVTSSSSGGDPLVSVRLGSGHFGFGSPMNFPVQAALIGAAAADVDGDGVLDLIVVSGPAEYGSQSSIVVYRGLGNGTFGPGVTTTRTESISRFDVADVNGDARADIAFQSTNSGTGNSVVVVAFGRTDDHFDGAVRTLLGTVAQAIRLADLNRDGRPDLLIVARYNYPGDPYELYPLLGDGTGAFTGMLTASGSEPNWVGYVLGNDPRDIEVADLDGDGIPDVVTADHGTNAVTFRHGNGDGTFLPPDEYEAGQQFPVPGAPTRIALADLNGDGAPDIAIAHPGTGTVSVWMNSGCGLVPIAYLRSQVHDGTAYIVWHVSAPGPYSISVLRYEDVGPWKFAGAPTHEPNGDLIFVDPHADVGHALHYKLQVAIGSCSAEVGEFTIYPSAEPRTNYEVPYGPGALVACDLDHDGHTDFVTTNFVARYLSVLRGDGAGGWQPPRRSLVGMRPLALITADFNGDGTPDFAMTNQDALLDTTCTKVVLGNPDGTIGLPRSLPDPTRGFSLATADFNRDGHPDLAVPSGNEGLSVFLGKGDGTFQHALLISTTFAPWQVAVGDLNEDGIPDLVIADIAPNGAQNVLEVRLGLGNGTFGSATSYPCPQEFYGLLVADLDGDHHLDVEMSEYRPNAGSQSYMWLMRGDGQGHLAPPVKNAVRRYVHRCVTGSIHANGAPDLVCGCDGDSAGVLIFPNEGALQFGPPMFMWTGQVGQVLFGDFTGDGRDDIAVTGGDDVELFSNLGDTTFVPDGTRTAQLRFRGTVPSPARAARILLAIELESRAPARVEVFDIQGRRVAAMDVPAPAPGARSLAMPARLRAGVYGVRLSQGGRSRQGRIVVLP